MNRLRPILRPTVQYTIVNEQSIRANMPELRRSVEAEFSRAVTKEDTPYRRRLLIVAEALRILGRDFGNTDSRFYQIADGKLMLAVAHWESPSWEHLFLLDNYCSAIAE